MSFGIPVRNGLGVGLLASTFLSSLRIGGRPAMFLNFIGTDSLDSRVTFTRALNTATRVNSSGFIETINANLPRFYYDPVTLAPKGLLIEEARTNLTLYSAMTSADFTAVGGTIANTGKLSPDGSANMLRFTEDTATSAHQTFISPAVPSVLAATTTYTASMYIFAGTRRYVVIHAGTNVNGWGVTVDTTNGTITGTYSLALGTYASSTITNAGNGIYRVTLTGQISAAVAQAYVLLCGSLVSNAIAPNTPYLGNGSTFFGWGAQIEAGAYATSYIPTTTLAVTRNADNAAMTGTNFSSWYNQTQGTFVVNASYAVAVNLGDRFTTQTDDATANNRILTTIDVGAVDVGGVRQATLDGGTPIDGVPNKLAFGYKVNDFAASLNGAAVVTDVSGTIPTVDRFTIGSRTGGSSFFNGYIRSIAYYNTRLPNATLQVLAT